MNMADLGGLPWIVHALCLAHITRLNFYHPVSYLRMPICGASSDLLVIFLLGLLLFRNPNRKGADVLMASYLRSSVSHGLECLVLLIMLEAADVSPSASASQLGVFCYCALLTSSAFALSRARSLYALLPAMGVGVSIILYHWRTDLLANALRHAATVIFAVILLRALPKAFSIGESFVVGHVLSYVFALCYRCLSACDGPTVLSWPARIGLSLCTGSLLATGLWSLLGDNRSDSAQRGNFHALLFSVTAAAISVLLLGKMRAFEHRQAILQEFITQPRLAVLIQWIGLLIVMLTATSAYLVFAPPTREKKTASVAWWVARFYEMQLMRKFYHFIAVPLFLPSIMRDIEWIRFGMLGAMAGFVFLEAVRLNCPASWLARFLSPKMESFRNGLDGGKPVLSHIWLLLGCLLPILGSNGSNHLLVKLMALSGVLSLGIMDACAALGGKLVGGPHWPGSNKTYSGSLIGIVAMIAAQALIVTFWYRRVLAGLDWMIVIVSSVTCGIWEATSDQNDNITLPLVALVTYSFFGTISA